MSDLDLLEQLEKHFNETPKEVLEQEFFEIECKTRGIDHTLPNAKQILKRQNRINKLKHGIFPKVYNTVCWMFCLWCAFHSGIYYTSGDWLKVSITLIGSIGWLHLFLLNKFGKDYIKF